MSRAADYTIKGFLYQFHKTLLAILSSSDDDIITVEGIIEDVEVLTPVELVAIQCKYHEASESFTPSSIYKPLLQMMDHFHKNPGTKIRYILFAHYPSVQAISPPVVGKSEIQAALGSTNKDFSDYVTTLSGNVNIDAFITKFSMEFGPSFDALVTQVCSALEKNGFQKGDIETLAYPNAVQLIASISVKHDPAERTITKGQLIDTLLGIRKTAISHWTMALSTRKQLLDARRKQLKKHLDKNSRLRYFLIDLSSLADFDAEIVLFISDYLDKYHFKQAHISTPVFCIRTPDNQILLDIQHRLYAKGIICADGFIGGQFDEVRFFREPFLSKAAAGTIRREFSLRLMRWDENGQILNNRKCDDLFIIGESNSYFDSLDTVDINVEHLATSSLKEVKYLIGVSNVYE